MTALWDAIDAAPSAVVYALAASVLVGIAVADLLVARRLR